VSSEPIDAEEHRRASGEAWEAASSGWAKRQEAMRRFGAPVSNWLVEAIHPQPGYRVLDLAAGIGETGFLAAELIQPGGHLITSDQAEGMLNGARARAEELGLTNVEFKVINGEWIDLPVADVDAVLCRWGYMLMADPAAALAETRRVLKSGGRVALAVWDTPDSNPWLSLSARLFVERGVVPAPAPGTPGPLALSDRERLRDLIEGAGFEDIEIDAVAVEQRHANVDAFWDQQLDISRTFHDAVMGLTQSESDALRAALVERLAPYTQADGELVMPGSSLVAAASA
jgi:ubiquinone/menaquinone biosynthesis C-methylase UbiE